MVSTLPISLPIPSSFYIVSPVQKCVLVEKYSLNQETKALDTPGPLSWFHWLQTSKNRWTVPLVQSSQYHCPFSQALLLSLLDFYANECSWNLHLLSGFVDTISCLRQTVWPVVLTSLQNSWQRIGNSVGDSVSSALSYSNEPTSPKTFVSNGSSRL